MQICQVCRCRSELVTGMRVCYQYICACKRGLSSMYGNYGIMRTPQRMCISPYSETTVWHIHRQNILRVDQVTRLIDAFMENMNAHSLGGSGKIKNVFYSLFVGEYQICRSHVFLSYLHLISTRVPYTYTHHMDTQHTGMSKTGTWRCERAHDILATKKKKKT